MKRKFFGAALACLLLAACHKNKQDLPTESDETITAVGTPDGQSVHKLIDAAGGELSSADGVIKLIIPAGALNAATDITIQPISNELTSGINHAYRLTPHGQQFSKPVTVIFNYKAQDTIDTRAEFLDIAFQDETGSWQMLTNTALNRAEKKISATITHFSDWGYFKSVTLSPATATVDQGNSIELKAATTFPRVDPDDAVPGTYTIKVLKHPRKLRNDEIRGWRYAGEGRLEPDGSWAFYTAPNHDPNINPEAVSVDIKMHRKGQFMLVSNITVLGNTRVEWLQVDEDWNAPGNNGKCVLYLYGNFGADPGAAKRSVKINGTGADVILWTPGIIQCHINETISGPIEIAADNRIVARSVLRKITGNFVYERFHGGVANAGSSNPLKEYIEFKFVFRGFGAPCPSNIPFLFPVIGSFAVGTESRFTVGGSATITTPMVMGCSKTSSVNIPQTSDIYFFEPHSIPEIPGKAVFKAEVTEVAGGLEAIIRFEKPDVVPGVVIHRTSNCSLPFDDPIGDVGVRIEGFYSIPIQFEYWETTEFKLKGTNELKTEMMASGIISAAWDNSIGNPTQYHADGLMKASFRDN